MRARAKRKVVCMDFDGVIHSNRKRWVGTHVINDVPVPGAKEGIAELRLTYRVIVYSGRCRVEGAAQVIEKWLVQHGILVDAVVSVKPNADYFVDDKAVCFGGDWSQLKEDVKSFRHWQSAGKPPRRKRGR